MKTNPRESAATLIEKVLTGETTPLVARNSWPQSKGDRLLDQAYHQLFHFEDDADIRTTDPKYLEWRPAQMRKFVFQLRGMGDAS